MKNSWMWKGKHVPANCREETPKTNTKKHPKSDNSAVLSLQNCLPERICVNKYSSTKLFSIYEKNKVHKKLKLFSQIVQRTLGWYLLAVQAPKIFISWLDNS